MKVKIDTKEKFHVITLEEPVLSANMTEELKQKLLSNMQKEIKNVILKLGPVIEIDRNIADLLVDLQQAFQITTLLLCYANCKNRLRISWNNSSSWKY